MSIGRYKASSRALRRVGGREAGDDGHAHGSGTGPGRVGHRRGRPPATAVQQAAERQRGGHEGQGRIGGPREGARGGGGARRPRRRRGERAPRPAGGGGGAGAGEGGTGGGRGAGGGPGAGGVAGGMGGGAGGVGGGGRGRGAGGGGWVGGNPGGGAPSARSSRGST